MNGNHPVLWVFRKEMREIMRDKRVRSGAFITPIFVVILMVSVFGIISSSVGKDAKQKVTVVQTKNSLFAELAKDKHLEIHTVSTEDEGRKLIESGKSNLVLEIHAPADGKQEVEQLYDPKEDSAEIAKAAVKQALAPYMASQAVVVLSAHGLSPTELENVTFKDTPVKVGEGAGAGAIIVGILPYMMVLFTFTGGFSIASDMVAGEKEKNTLETLLISPVHRTQIVLGKFLAIGAVCAVSGLSSVLGLVLASTLHLPGAALMFSGGGLGLTPRAILTIAFVLLPLVAFFSGLLIAVSSYARNIREAQTMLSTVNLIILIPAILSQVIGFTDFAHSNWINFVPVLGTAMNIREAFQGKATVLSASESILTGLVLAAIMLFIAVRLFVREQVLVRI
jgi:sodium transport system permease protein